MRSQQPAFSPPLQVQGAGNASLVVVGDAWSRSAGLVLIAIAIVGVLFVGALLLLYFGTVQPKSRPEAVAVKPIVAPAITQPAPALITAQSAPMLPVSDAARPVAMPSAPRIDAAVRAAAGQPAEAPVVRLPIAGAATVPPPAREILATAAKEPIASEPEPREQASRPTAATAEASKASGPEVSVASAPIPAPPPEAPARAEPPAPLPVVAVKTLAPAPPEPTVTQVAAAEPAVPRPSPTPAQAVTVNPVASAPAEPARPQLAAAEPAAARASPAATPTRVDPPEPQVPIVLRLVSRPQPSFPRAALVEGVFKGSVVARLTVGTDGRVGAVTIVSSNPPRLFDRAAQSALSNWRFEPIPRPTTAQIELAFRAE